MTEFFGGLEDMESGGQSEPAEDSGERAALREAMRRAADEEGFTSGGPARLGSAQSAGTETPREGGAEGAQTEGTEPPSYTERSLAAITESIAGHQRMLDELAAERARVIAETLERIAAIDAKAADLRRNLSGCEAYRAAVTDHVPNQLGAEEARPAAPEQEGETPASGRASHGASRIREESCSARSEEQESPTPPPAIPLPATVLVGAANGTGANGAARSTGSARDRAAREKGAAQ